MPLSIKPGYRGPAAGVAAAALLVGAFLLGTARSGPAAAQPRNGVQDAALISAQPGAKITVAGTGTVNGTPNQLQLSMGVQVNGVSVGSALAQANRAVSRVIASLRAGGVRAADIATSGLSIDPNYQSNSQVPVGYGVSEQLTATLTNLAKAGSQIQAAVGAGGNATVLDGVSLNLTDTSGLLARARAAAVHDAQAKAGQFAQALGRRLGPVVSISDQSATVPYPIFANSAAGLKSAAPVPISPGTQQVSVQVTVVYSIG
ncbi:MAG TPA: SIMPL domain-containing protein [Streptosporangiaceae bacterium]|nr:SIMPL domain-containing protein [Streptosporangiaceae bacterium]